MGTWVTYEQAIEKAAILLNESEKADDGNWGYKSVRKLLSIVFAKYIQHIFGLKKDNMDEIQNDLDTKCIELLKTN